jgi:hypothetical protein
MVFSATSREMVGRLYFKAKAQRIPMTVLVNRLIEQALGPDESSDIPIAEEATRKQLQNSKPR